MNDTAMIAPGVIDKAIKPHINSTALEWVGRAQAWLSKAKAAKPIETVEEHAQAVAARKTIGEAKRQIEAVRTEHVAPYLAAQRAINAFFGTPAEQVAETLKLLDGRILTFEKAEAQRREAAEREARAAREAEAKRLREEAARIERETREREAAALAEAAALEDAGKVDAAEDVIDAAMVETAGKESEALNMAALADIVEHAPIHSLAPSLSTGGTSRRKHYSAKVVDPRLIVEAWLRGQLPTVAVQINEQYFNAQARLLKEAMNFPGVELVVDTRIGG